MDLSTETGARKFWTDPNVPSYDVESPYYRWERHWTRPELEAAINKGLLDVSKDGSTKDFVSPLFTAGQSIGRLKSIDVRERGRSGKAMVVDIQGTNGTWTVEKEFLIRKVFANGGRMLPSANLVFTPRHDAKGNLVGMLANGGGFGHGVGMSQLGASWMHKHGYKFPQIIEHYYRGVSLGSTPIAVGPGYPGEPVVTRFDVSRPEGMLWVQEGDGGNPSPFNRDVVRLKLNGKELTVSPEGYRSGIRVDSFLKPGDLNALVLYPDAAHPERTLRAWIELYPPAKS
jgi:hypothetical protein